MYPASGRESVSRETLVVSTWDCPTGLTAACGKTHWASTQYTVAVARRVCHVWTSFATAVTRLAPSTLELRLTHASPFRTTTSSSDCGVPRSRTASWLDVRPRA